MEQVLFVLHDGKISQWNLSRGRLKAATIGGLHQVPYSAETSQKYWEDWKKYNNVSDKDDYDTIFLSDGPNDFDKLPKWICVGSKEKSAWTCEQLSILAQEEYFNQTSLCLVQGKIKHLIGTDKPDTAVVLHVRSSHAFALPDGTAIKKSPGRESKCNPERISVSSPNSPTATNVFVGDSYKDVRALQLKVGDKFPGKIEKYCSLLGCCYVKTSKTNDLIKVRLQFTNKTLSARSSIFTVSKEVMVEVVSVEAERVKYSLKV